MPLRPGLSPFAQALEDLIRQHRTTQYKLAKAIGRSRDYVASVKWTGTASPKFAGMIEKHFDLQKGTMQVHLTVDKMQDFCSKNDYTNEEYTKLIERAIEMFMEAGPSEEETKSAPEELRTDLKETPAEVKMTGPRFSKVEMPITSFWIEAADALEEAFAEGTAIKIHIDKFTRNAEHIQSELNSIFQGSPYRVKMLRSPDNTYVEVWLTK